MQESQESIELQVRPPKVPPSLTSFVLAIVVMLMTCGVAWYMHGQARIALIDEIRHGLGRIVR